MNQHRRDGSIHSEDSKVDLFNISDKLHIHTYENRHHWSFAFTHASTSSKCILILIQCLIQHSSRFKYPWTVEWIVSEMIDWLKVRNPALIKEIFFNPDTWEEPNSGSSATRLADRTNGRGKQEN